MAEVPVSALVELAAQFNDIAHQSFPSRESHAAFHALLDESANLTSLEGQLQPFNDEAKEHVKTIQENQPSVSPLNQLTEALTMGQVSDIEQLPDRLKEQIKAIAKANGIDPDAPFTPDTPQAAEAKALAVSAAEQALEEISERAAPTMLLIQETITSALKQTLPQEVYEEVASAFEVDESVSAAYAANNAPTLAATFAPRPQA